MLRIYTLVATVLAALSINGCSQIQNPFVVSSPSPSPSVTPSPEPVVAAPSPLPTPLPSATAFEAGLEKASKASYSARNAESKEDWELTASRWQQAIELMKSLPANNPNYAQAQKNVPQYQRNLNVAQKKAKAINADTNSTSTVTSPTYAKSNEVSIEDFFASYMDVTVNQGGSGSEYWCSQSKQFETSFFAPRSYRVLDVHIAPNRQGGSITFQLDSSNRGGSQITANWVIVIQKEKNKKIAQQTLGGWCVSMLWDKS